MKAVEVYQKLDEPIEVSISGCVGMRTKESINYSLKVRIFYKSIPRPLGSFRDGEMLRRHDKIAKERSLAY
ncbi:MAG: hypothetical protein QXO94_05845 [Candidatus Bathyarchaeia archaeon]